MFFHAWADLYRVVLVTTTTFVLVVALLRLVGQQSLAKMSGFDAVATVTIGAIVATVAVTKEVTVSEALVALLTILGLQELIRWLQSRYLVAHHAVRESPRVLVWDGQLLEDRLRESNISADEIRAALRKAGLRSIGEARAVVLENDGEWSVIAKSRGESDESAFFGLPIPGRPANSPADDAGTARPAPAKRLP
jgi:uncharacterized membrane protein YcaP (DUF421 family)